ncbi:MAG: HEAT repeat domain-containing protein [archaeon]|nr:HEAT repeat domain-containing protein [archaeon]
MARTRKHSISLKSKGKSSEPKRKGLTLQQIQKLQVLQARIISKERAEKIIEERKFMPEIIMIAQHHPNSLVRADAINVIGKLKDTRLIPLFKKALKDKEVGVRLHAIMALGLFRNPKLIPIFKKALSEEWWIIRAEAMSALRKLKDPKLISLFKERAFSPYLNAVDTAMAKEALKEIREREGK